MKKLTALFVCLLLWSSFVLTACQNEETPSSEESEVVSSSEEDEKNQENQGSGENNNDASKDEPALWKDAYLKLIELKKESSYSYALVYLDGDDLPELYLNGISEAEGDSVYAYKNGKLLEQHLKRCYGGKYLERSGKIINESGHMGYSYTDVFQLSEDGFTQLFQGSEIQRVEHLGNEEYRYYSEYFIEEAPVPYPEYTAALQEVFDLWGSRELSDHAVSYEVIKQQIAHWQKDDTSFLPQEVKNSWRSDLVAILSGVDLHDPDRGMYGSFSVGLMDLNFDNIPEVLVAFPGGSMGNIFIEIYDLSTHEKLMSYDGANDNDLGIRLYIAKAGERYVTLSTGFLRDSDLGSRWSLDQIPDTMESKNGYLQCKGLFTKAGYEDFWIGGEEVTEETYEEEYQGFLKDHTEISRTQIQMIRWADLDLNNKDGIAERMADALIQSPQKFIDFKK